MESLFNQPQRQSPIGVLVMFLDTIRLYARAIWPILVIWLFKFDEINKGYFLVGTVSFILIIGIIAYLKYLNFTFYLDNENEEFIISDGIFNKTKTAIQVHKIQQVNINQSLLQRMIGVYALEVDTAGGQDKEVKIKAISHALALELKARLLDNSKQTQNANEHKGIENTSPTAVFPFIRISFLSLLKVGITSNYIRSFSLLLIFFFTVSDNINRFTGRDLLHDENLENYVAKDWIIQAFLVALFALIALVLIINLVRIIFKYYDYKITKQKGSLLLSFGLLNTKSTIIKPEKVQITAISRNYFQKKMNILEIKIKQATHGEKEERNAAIEIPGCSDNESDAILKLLFQKIPQKGVRLQPNFRKLGFAIFLTIVLPMIVFYIFRSYNPSIGLAVNYLIPIYVIFVGILQFFKFKNYRLFVNEEFIIKQSGAWDVQNEIIEPCKIQAITTSQLFWHKSLNIGSLTLHTAGGNIVFQLGDYNKIKAYINLWLYEIEISDSNWM